MSATVPSRAWHLTARPHGTPVPGDFELREVALPEPGPGQVLVRNAYLSVDPYMRGRMNDVKSYARPYALDAPMEGGAVGVVVASRSEDLPEGTHVLHNSGWRDHAVLDTGEATALPADAAPLAAYLGVLGMPGLTAYGGLLRSGGFRAGDTVFVSGASGAVGSLVGQIARLKGAARVVGSAGSDEKVRLLTERYGFDAAFNYKSDPVGKQLRAAAPDGIDLYFDNVGGEHLEAALNALKVHGRVAICGMIGGYNATEPPAAPRNLQQIIGKRLTVKGLLVLDFEDLRTDFLTEVGGWLSEGTLRYEETVVKGLDSTLDAFLGLFAGANTGKMIIEL